MYINAGKKGRLRLVGRIVCGFYALRDEKLMRATKRAGSNFSPRPQVKSRNQFIQLAVPNEGKGDAVVCENTFRTALVFTEASWVEGPAPSFALENEEAEAGEGDAGVAASKSLAVAAAQYEREELRDVPEDVLVSCKLVGNSGGNSGSKGMRAGEEEEEGTRGDNATNTSGPVNVNFGNIASRKLEAVHERVEGSETDGSNNEEEDGDGDEDDDGDEEETAGFED